MPLELLRPRVRARRLRRNVWWVCFGVVVRRAVGALSADNLLSELHRPRMWTGRMRRHVWRLRDWQDLRGSRGVQLRATVQRTNVRTGWLRGQLRHVPGKQRVQRERAVHLPSFLYG